MIQWKRGENIKITANFSTKEFCCTCGICLDQRIDRQLVEKLQAVRDEVKLPLTITSGFRCARKQQMLRDQGYETASGISTHEMGQAVDVTCSDIPALAKAAEKHFMAIGTARTFVHLDLRVGKVRRWGYK